jgi:hypothetical protein
MSKPSVNKVQDCIDSAGRLAAFISELYGDCSMLDLLTICAESNVSLARDTTTALAALNQLQE